MDERPEFEFVVSGKASQRDGWHYRMPMVRDPKTYEWVEPEVIVTEQVYMLARASLPPVPTGVLRRKQRRWGDVSLPVYEWEPA